MIRGTEAKKPKLLYFPSILLLTSSFSGLCRTCKSKFLLSTTVFEVNMSEVFVGFNGFLCLFRSDLLFPRFEFYFPTWVRTCPNIMAWWSFPCLWWAVWLILIGLWLIRFVDSDSNPFVLWRLFCEFGNGVFSLILRFWIHAI